MYNRIKNLIFTVLIVVMSASLIYADRVDTGWKGYGLYNLNKSEVSILNEADTVTINGGIVAAVYEYTIHNNSAEEITVNFGYPDNGIYKFSVHDGSKFLNYKTRDNTYLVNNYKVEGLQTPEGRWYLFNMAFKPDQTRIIKVSIDSEMKKAENDTYGLSFFKDRSYSYAIPGEKTKFTLKLSNFKPYSIFELEGIKPEDISTEGAATLSYSGSYGSGISIKYQPIDKMAIDRLNASEYKKPKAIVRAFNSKNYNEALTLCNEYISAPSDNRLSLEQVKYVRAECSRLLNNNEEYISGMEQLDISKLYPDRIRYKVLVDKLSAYDTMNNDEAIDKILGELISEQQNYPYLHYWLSQNGYRLSENKQKEAEVASYTEKTSKSISGKGFDILGAAMKFLTVLRESRWTYVILGFVIGFIVGRLTKKGRKKRSTYLFRN
ncbi:MAG: hypothetical protein ACYCYE_12270 [Clostridia bacterium]